MKEAHRTVTPLQTMQESYGDIQALFKQVQCSRNHTLEINSSDFTEMNTLMNYLT